VIANRPTGLVLSPGQKAMLATKLAAMLLDLFEAIPDPILLAEMRRYANVAWAISHCDEVSMVYRRLRSLSG